MKRDNKKSRREFIKQAAVASIGTMVLPEILRAENKPINNVQFTLSSLPYAYDALEPHIDKLTMEIHHSKHHQAYVNNLNKALTEINAGHVTLQDLCANVSKHSAAVRNNAGGHYNHDLFWSLMIPGGKNEKNPLIEAITSTFGSLENFKTKFNDAALKHFGSGWAWLIIDANKKLQIGTTPNQDNPIMDISEFKGKPILAIDVWEHAYYLKHQNKRVDYINAWWNVVNWEKANALFAEVTGN